MYLRKPIVVMVHRIKCNDSSIEDLYYQRNLVFKIDILIKSNIRPHCLKSFFNRESLKEVVYATKKLYS